MFITFMEGSRFINRKEHYKKHLPQQKASQRALELFGQLSSESEPKKEVDFFFYTNTLAKANKLKHMLEGMSYEVFELHDTAGKISVTGTTCPIAIDEKSFLEWVDQMNDLGYSCDCDFDGWGMGSELDEPLDPDSIF